MLEPNRESQKSKRLLEREQVLLREDSPGKDEDLHEMLQYMTPRPDWSKVSQYVDGDLDGLPSTELVARCIAQSMRLGFS